MRTFQTKRGRMHISNRMRFLTLIAIVTVVVAGLTWLITWLVMSHTGGDGRFVVGVSEMKPPFVDRFGHELSGVDVTIADKVAQELEKELVIVEMPENELLPALISGAVDMVGGAYAPGDSAVEGIEKTESYYTAGLVGMARAGSGVETLAQLQGQKTGVLVAAAEAMQDATPLDGIPRAGYPNIIMYSHARYAIAQLREGVIAAVFVDRSVAEAFTAQYSDLAVFELEAVTQEVEDYAYMLRSGAAEIKVVNEVLQQMKESGEMQTLIGTYSMPAMIMQGLEMAEPETEETGEPSENSGDEPAEGGSDEPEEPNEEETDPADEPEEEQQTIPEDTGTPEEEQQAIPEDSDSETQL